jgi:hypothetical protein
MGSLISPKPYLPRSHFSPLSFPLSASTMSSLNLSSCSSGHVNSSLFSPRSSPRPTSDLAVDPLPPLPSPPFASWSQLWALASSLFRFYRTASVRLCIAITSASEFLSGPVSYLRMEPRHPLAPPPSASYSHMWSSVSSLSRPYRSTSVRLCAIVASTSEFLSDPVLDLRKGLCRPLPPPPSVSCSHMWSSVSSLSRPY